MPVGPLLRQCGRGRVSVRPRAGAVIRARGPAHIHTIEAMSSRFIARDVACGSATGQIYDYGAHVTAWQPRSEQPVIWTPQDFLPDDGAAIRGGIPVCFPWFNTGPDGDKHPAHGRARTSRWLLLDSFLNESDKTHTLTYRLTPKRLGEADGWAFEAQLAVTFGRELDVRLSVTNRDDEDATFEEALHTYVAVGDITRCTVLGLDDDDYLDFTQPTPTRHTQSLDVRFDGETVDRVYFSDAPVTIEDPNNARRIVIRKTGSATTVVWNPGIEGAREKAGLDDGDWKRFVCIEAANCKDDALTLAPGETHVMTQTLSVEHL